MTYAFLLAWLIDFYKIFNDQLDERINDRDMTQELIDKVNNYKDKLNVFRRTCIEWNKKIQSFDC